MAPKFAGLDQSWFPLRSMWYTLPVAWWFTAAVIDPTKSVNTGHTIVVTPPLTANAARVAAHLEVLESPYSALLTAVSSQNAGTALLLL
ncbi:MAG: hypothetical protein U0U25_11790 [Flavobacteriales bacterium]